MKIKKASLIFNNVLKATLKCNKNECLKNLLEFKESILNLSTELIYPTGPAFFSILNYDEELEEVECEFYVPINRTIKLKNNNMYTFYKEFKIFEGLSLRMIDLDDDIKEVYNLLRICSEENNLEIKEPFYHIYMENYGAEVLEVYVEVQ